MGKCVDKGYIPYTEINICDGCIHKDVCDDKDYLTENRCSAKIQGDIEHIVELINAEEQGLLVRMPCKVGDTVYELTEGFSIYKPGLHVYISEHTATELNIYNWARRGDFGKTVFLTREKAEKALKEAR